MTNMGYKWRLIGVWRWKTAYFSLLWDNLMIICSFLWIVAVINPIKLDLFDG